MIFTWKLKIFYPVRVAVLAVLYLGYEAIYGAAVTNNNLADGSQANWGGGDGGGGGVYVDIMFWFQ